jgi:hypothetical protein
MAEKPKVQGDQVRAFRKAARELGADESEAGFDAALKKVARHKSVDDPMPVDPETPAERGKRNFQKD